MKRVQRLRLHLLAAVLLIAPLLSLIPAEPAQAAYACPCGIFGNSVPGIVDQGPDAPNKIGVAFTVDTYGWATGMRFYKSAADTGSHLGQLRAHDDINYAFSVAHVTFTNETASGWQTATFDHPVYLYPGLAYSVTYTSPNGHWSYFPNYLTTAVDSGPIHVLSNGGRWGHTASDLMGDGGKQTSNSAFAVDIVFETAVSNETSLFKETAATPADPVDSLGQVGTRFSSDVNTNVIGVRYWSESSWFHPGVGYLYASSRLTSRTIASLGMVARSMNVTRR